MCYGCAKSKIGGEGESWGRKWFWKSYLKIQFAWIEFGFVTYSQYIVPLLFTSSIPSNFQGRPLCLTSICTNQRSLHLYIFILNFVVFIKATHYSVWLFAFVIVHLDWSWPPSFTLHQFYGEWILKSGFLIMTQNRAWLCRSWLLLACSCCFHIMVLIVKLVYGWLWLAR